MPWSEWISGTVQPAFGGHEPLVYSPQRALDSQAGSSAPFIHNVRDAWLNTLGNHTMIGPNNIGGPPQPLPAAVEQWWSLNEFADISSAGRLDASGIKYEVSDVSGFRPLLPEPLWESVYGTDYGPIPGVLDEFGDEVYIEFQNPAAPTALVGWHVPTISGVRYDCPTNLGAYFSIYDCEERSSTLVDGVPTPGPYLYKWGEGWSSFPVKTTTPPTTGRGAVFAEFTTATCPTSIVPPDPGPTHKFFILGRNEFPYYEGEYIPPNDYSLVGVFGQVSNMWGAYVNVMLPTWRYWIPGTLPLRQFPRDGDGLAGSTIRHGGITSRQGSINQVSYY